MSWQTHGRFARFHSASSVDHRLRTRGSSCPRRWPHRHHARFSVEVRPSTPSAWCYRVWLGVGTELFVPEALPEYRRWLDPSRRIIAFRAPIGPAPLAGASAAAAADRRLHCRRDDLRIGLDEETRRHNRPGAARWAARRRALRHVAARLRLRSGRTLGGRPARRAIRLRRRPPARRRRGWQTAPRAQSRGGHSGPPAGFEVVIRR